MFFLKLGFRNLMKNRRRTLLTMSAVIIGMAALILANGFVRYSLWGLRESTIQGGVGHFQIYKKGFKEFGEEKPYDYLITGYKKIMRELAGIPGIKLTAPRLNFQGMIFSAEKSTVIMGISGLDEEEKKLMSFSTLENSRFISDDKPYDIVIGAGAARNISAKIGDSGTIMVAMKDGSINAIDFNIAGIMHSQLSEMENVYALAGLGTIQKLLNTPDSIDTLAVLLQKTEDMEKIEPRIRAVCDKYGLEYRRWDQLVPMYASAKEFYESSMRVALIVIFAIVVLAVTNTMLMVVFERVREIGTIRSLGTTRSMVLQLFISESFILGAAGSFFGIIAGIILAQTINGLGGIPLPPPPGNARSYHGMFSLDFAAMLMYYFMFILVSVIASIYPAWKAARLSIADALRWI